MKRKIIEINKEKCNGCGSCIPDCPEGALQVIDGKARLVSDLFCDGLGACIGSCPTGAINVIEREAKPYNEAMVMEQIVKQGANVTKAHLMHLKNHREITYFNEALNYLKQEGIKNPLEENVHPQTFHGCPGSRMMEFKKTAENSTQQRQESQLQQWPIQLMLVPPNAPYFNNAHLLIAADCVPFAYANFHNDFLKNHTLIIGCPKLDDADFYREKLVQILKYNTLQSISVVHMEVPCCYGLNHIVEEAIKESGKKIPFYTKVITLRGECE